MSRRASRLFQSFSMLPIRDKHRVQKTADNLGLYIPLKKHLFSSLLKVVGCHIPSHKPTEYVQRSELNLRQKQSFFLCN